MKSVWTKITGLFCDDDHGLLTPARRKQSS